MALGRNRARSHTLACTTPISHAATGTYLAKEGGHLESRGAGRREENARGIKQSFHEFFTLLCVIATTAQMPPLDGIPNVIELTADGARFIETDQFFDPVRPLVSQSVRKKMFRRKESVYRLSQFWAHLEPGDWSPEKYRTITPFFISPLRLRKERKLRSLVHRIHSTWG